MTDKLNITIRIAGQPPMTLNIDRDYEQTARTAEYQVNGLYGRWSDRFRDKSPMEVMSMVAYRFAELYYTQGKSVLDAEQMLDDFEAKLDEILVETAKK